jgi:hypothetical protein
MSTDNQETAYLKQKELEIKLKAEYHRRFIAAKKKRSLVLILTCIAIIFSTTLLVLYNKNYIGSNIQVILGATLVIGLATIILPQLARYLEEGSNITRLSDRVTAQRPAPQIPDIPQGSPSVLAALTENEKQILSQKLHEQRASEVKSEDELKLQLIDFHSESLQTDITIQIGKISRSGTINLMIGLGLTVLAISMLIFLIFFQSLTVQIFDKNTTEWDKFFIKSAPKYSVVLFIEIFSFFFLNLYKRGSDEIKYFNNERTNIQSKMLALKAAILFDQKESITKSIESLFNVDRNSILKKDETTFEIEKMRSEKNSMDKLVEQMGTFSKLFGGKSKD